MANSNQNTNSKYKSFTGHTNGCAQQNPVLMANVYERSPGEEVWDDSWHGIQTVIWWHPDVCAVAFSPHGRHFASAGEDRQLLVWKSNLHTFDANSSRNKQASSQRVQIDFSHATAPHNSAIDTPVAGVPKSCDEGILIDPRQSVAYGMRDGNFLVLDSQHTTREPSPSNFTTPHRQQQESLDKVETYASADSISNISNSSTSFLHMPNKSNNSDGQRTSSKYF
ncbi:PREDICTED: uncharacterized protein LOC108377960 [Rhagoletis zephyria]|uniref:uncharacterized protein LOC108377960 n=1 Tax=Rhagoletis zephyria TaxID=28612 RepID=UPI0008119D7D|nr:PREDICTED: uncharacterized protein LOC108377960 [Rhagoletis zephyria]